MITTQKIISLCTFSLSAFVIMAQEPDMVEIDGKIFEKVEVEAAYTGGVEAWKNFLIKNLNPSVPLDKGAPAGNYTVVVQFVVDKDGNVSEIKGLTNHGYGMEQEVIRIMKMSGKWTSAMQNGRPVKAYRKQPVTFQVLYEGVSITTDPAHTLFTKTDNAVTIKVDKIKPQDVYVTISAGSIINMSNGRYVVRVSKPGNAIIRVFHAKKDILLSAESFEVKEK